MHNIYFGKRCITLSEKENNKIHNSNSIILHYSDDFNSNIILDILNNYPLINHVVIYTKNKQDLETLYKETCSLFKEINAAGGLVENEKGEFLLIYRNEMWDLPKGKQEPGEEIKYSALREVEEECGIEKITLGNVICVTSHCYKIGDDFCLKHTYWYNMKYLNGHKPIPQLEENIQKAIWVKKEHLDNYLKETYPSIKEVFAEAGININRGAK